MSSSTPKLIGLDYLIKRLNPRICLREKKPSTYLLNVGKLFIMPSKSQSWSTVEARKPLETTKTGCEINLACHLKNCVKLFDKLSWMLSSLCVVGRLGRRTKESARGINAGHAFCLFPSSPSRWLFLDYYYFYWDTQ